jgi:hypothetical protein
LAKDEKIAYKTINARAETVRGTGPTDGKPVELSTDDDVNVNSIVFNADSQTFAAACTAVAVRL